ncbi:MAG: TIGR01906 family membrane protein [Candidatus Nanoarchaeia archaeon]|nr:TIGR01906 family membrane protein [Candidatus Nanoarchaeia archaeon]
MKARNKKRIIIALFAFFAVLMYLLSAVRISAFDEGFYASFFRAKDIYASLPDADARAGNLLGYIKEGSELNPAFFNEKETAHMKDVKTLFSLSAVLLMISMLFCFGIIAYAFFKRDISLMAHCLIAGGIASLSFVLVLVLLSINFQWVFEKFHTIFFSNSLWLMNPETDRIIVLLPESFFRLIARRIFLTSAVLSFGMLAAGLLVKYMEKKLYGILQHN